MEPLQCPTLAVKGYGLELEGDVVSGYTLQTKLEKGAGIGFEATHGNGLKITNKGNDLLICQKGLTQRREGELTFLRNDAILDVKGGDGVDVVLNDQVATVSSKIVSVKGGVGISVDGKKDLVLTNTAPLLDVVARGTGVLASLKEGVLSLLGSGLTTVKGEKGLVATVADGVATVSHLLKGGKGVEVKDDVISSTGVLSVKAGVGVSVEGTQDVVVSNTAPLLDVKTTGPLRATLKDGKLELECSAVDRVVGGQGIEVKDNLVLNTGVLSVSAEEGLAVEGKQTVVLRNKAPLYEVSATGTGVSAKLVDGKLTLNGDAITGVKGEGIGCETTDGVATLSNKAVMSVEVANGLVATALPRGGVLLANDGVLSLSAGANISLSSARGHIVVGAVLPPVAPVPKSHKVSVCEVNVDTMYGGGGWQKLTLPPASAGWLKIDSHMKAVGYDYYCDFDVVVECVARAKEVEWGWSSRISEKPMLVRTNSLEGSTHRLGLTPVCVNDVSDQSPVQNYLYIRNNSQEPLTLVSVNPSLFWCV